MSQNIFAAIMAKESGGQNVNNYKYASNPSYYSASGYFQMTDSTFLSTPAGQASGVSRAIDAPYSVQQAAAGQLIQRNGLGDWAPYDGLDPNVSHYDLTPLSGPNGSPVDQTGGSGSPSAWQNSQAINPNMYPGYTGPDGTSVSTLGGQNSATFNSSQDSYSNGSDGLFQTGGSGASPYGSLTGANGSQLGVSGNAAQMAALPPPDGIASDTSYNANPSAGQQGTPASVPVAITTGDNQVAQATQSAAQTAAKQSQANTQAADATATGIYAKVFGLASDGFMRIALVITGLVIMAGAFWLMSTEEGQEVVGNVDKFARRVPLQV